MIEDTLTRRCVRLLAAVHELHKQGYQDLAAFCCLAPSGASWRCKLVPFDCIQWDGNSWITIPETDAEFAHHSSGSVGNEYFGWTDAKSDTARNLAEKIKTRFPRLMNQAQGLNLKHAGWFSYLLGIAEQGHLPIMAAEYKAASRDRLATTTSDVWAEGPPFFSMWQFRDKWFYYTRPPHLRPGDDWHTAYRKLILEWQNTRLRCPLPQYPIETRNIFELGAFWEGAIYYIQSILGFTDIRRFLATLEAQTEHSEPWDIFFHVWNSQGKMMYLSAFLIHRLMREHNKYRIEQAERVGWEQRLNNFECHTRQQWIESGKPPNPYYGGGNPLHLGLILSGENEDRLVNP